MKRFLAAAAPVALAFVVVCRQAAGADPVADLKASLTAAMAQVKSMQLQITSPAGGMTSVATVVANPLQMHMQMASGAITIEMYLSGNILYQNVANTGWKKIVVPLPSVPGDMLKLVSSSSALTPKADAIDAGVAYGAFELQTPTAAIPGAPAAAPLTMLCTYDKATFRLHTCATGVVTEAFGKYNDPSNTVVLPAELNAAPAAGPTP